MSLAGTERPLSCRPEGEQVYQAFDGKSHVTMKGDKRRMGQSRRERDRLYFLKVRMLGEKSREKERVEAAVGETSPNSRPAPLLAM